MKSMIFLVLILFSVSSYAGYFEISASGSYRKTSYDENNYSVYRSGTGSVAYYFWEMSALELNYTKARSDEIKSEYQARSYVTFYGADLIFTLASKQSLFQPYIKVGAAYQHKKASYKQTNVATVTHFPDIKGWAPSGGVGLKFILGKHVALKAGVDAWSSPLSQDKVTYDYAGRVGLSLLF